MTKRQREAIRACTRRLLRVRDELVVIDEIGRVTSAIRACQEASEHPNTSPPTQEPPCKE